MNKTVEIMIDSASRPELLLQTLESLWKYLRYNNGVIVWKLHEAVLFPAESRMNVDMAMKSNYFDVIYIQKEPKGEGCSINTILQQCEASYFLHWEDDYEALREIPVHTAVEIMEKDSSVNQVIFNRRDTMIEVAGWYKKEYIKAGHVMTTSPHWRITPALWRMSFIKSKWRPVEGGNFHWAINGELQKEIERCREGKTPEWVNENLGTFYLGGIGESAYCRHIGFGKSNRGES